MLRYSVACAARVFVLGLIAFWWASDAHSASRKEVTNAIEKASDFLDSMSTNGGYVGIYSLDLKQRFGEALFEKATASEIWVQPPGTPSVGLVYLRLYRLTGNARYLKMARAAGRALAWGQRAEGGWDHRVDVSSLTADAGRPERKSGRCTFDDQITQGAIEFLMELDQVLDEVWLDEAVELGMAFLLEAQFDHGGWSQWFPLRGGYHDYFTFNDRAINDCIDVLIRAYELYGERRFLEAAAKGGEFIQLSQLPEPQGGWAQQYDHGLKPAWARSFEPPGVCSAATVHNVNTLIRLAMVADDTRFFEGIDRALKWLNRSVLKPGQISRKKYPEIKSRQRRMWARLYEVGSNRPIYGDRQVGYEVFYDLDTISEKERTSYGWQGTYGVDSTSRRWKQIQGQTFSEWRRGELARDHSNSRNASDGLVDSVVGALDDQGRWITGNMIRIGDYVRHLNLLADYLERKEP